MSVKDKIRLAISIVIIFIAIVAAYFCVKQEKAEEARINKNETEITTSVEDK